jgi:hypothetical protein
MMDVVNKALGYDGDYLDEEGYEFYYKCIALNNMSVYDADEYALLNTLIGYDIGKENAMKISSYLYENDLGGVLDLDCRDESKQDVRKAIDALNLNIDLSKWKNSEYVAYEYHMNEK